MFLSRWFQKLSRKTSRRQSRKNAKNGTAARPWLEILEDRLVPAVLFWDANGALAGIGGSGTWVNGGAQWNTMADGSGATVAWNNANNDTAVFGDTAGTVSVSGSVTAGAVDFDTTGYSLTGGTLTLTTGAHSIDVDSGESATIASTVAGTVGLTKTGAGTLLLTATNSYSGNTAINEGMLQVGNNSVGVAAINNSANVSIASGATFRYYRGDTSQLILGNTFTGAGNIQLSGAGTTDIASQWTVASVNNSGFTGRWVLDGARLNVDSQTDLGASSTVEVQANGQILFVGNVAYANNIIVTDSSGWRDGGFRLGAIRMENNSNLSGNITLNQTTVVTNGDPSGFGAVISGYSTGTHILSGVISGTGEFSLSRFTAWNGGTASRVDFILSGSSSNTYTGKTVVDGQHGGNPAAGASLWLSKTDGAKAIAANTVVQFGINTGGAANLRMGGNDQFGAGVVMNFSSTGGHHRFDLKGTNQTLAGINAGTLTTQAAAVIQNQGIDGVVPTGNATLTLNGSGIYTYNGWLRDQDNSGTARKLNIVKDGSGTQTFVGSQISYTGTTAVNDGKLALSATPGFASSTTTINAGGTLELNSANTAVDNWRINTILAGAGVINKTGTGWIQTSTNAHTFSGTFNVQAGTFGTSSLNSNWAGITADFNISSNALLDARGQAITVGSLNGSGSVGNTWNTVATVNVGAGNKSGNFSGSIQGNATSATNTPGNPNGAALNFVKTGSGTQTLTGNNIYSGTTTISGGALEIGNGGTTGTLGTGGVTNNASLIVNRSNTITVSNAISGTGSLTKRGAGTLALTNGGNTYSGGTILSQGTIDASGINGLGGSTVATARDFTFGDAMTAGGDLRLRLNGNFSLRDITVSAYATGANTLEIATAGGSTFNINSVNLANALTFSLTGGALEDIQFNATTNVITGGTAPGTDALIFHSTTGQTLRTSVANGMAPGAIDFTGNVRVSGNVNWQMQNRSYIDNSAANQNLWIPDTSSVTVDAGATWTFTWGDETIAGLNGAGNVQAHPGTGAHTLTVGGGDANGNFSGAINGSATSLIKIGAGTQILGGSSNYSGATTVNGGVLQVNGSVANSAVTVNNGGALAGNGVTGAVTVQSGGALAPGASIGSISTGNLNLAAGSDYKVEVGAGAADRTNVTGSVTLAGNLVTSGTPPQNNGAALVIINNDANDAVNGTFAGLAEGTTVTVGSVSYFITYKYNADTNTLGTGNDVALIDNTPPTANDDTYAVTEDTPLNVVAPGVLANDTDPQAPPQTLTVSRVSVDGGTTFIPVTAAGVTISTSKGSLLIRTDGSFTYTPDADENGEDNVTLYWSTDGIEESSAATVTFMIAEVNDDPDAVDDSNATTELGTVSGDVLVTDSTGPGHESGQSLTVTNPGTYTGAYGTLTLNSDGNYSYTASANQLTAGQVVTDTFSYSVTDDGTTNGSPDPKTDSATLTITITGENDAPTATDDSGATTELGTTTGNVLSNDTDPDSGETTTLVVDAPGSYTGTYGTLTLDSDGSYTYTANVNPLTAGEIVIDTFSYQARDVHGTTSNTSTLTITITGENDAPTANGDSGATTELGTTTGNVLGNDSDPDTGETGTLVVNSPGTYTGAYGTLMLNSNGSYSYVASANQLAAGQVVTDSFTYQAKDAQSATSNPATLTITLTGENDAPTANNDGNSVTEDGGPVIGNVLSNDSDVDSGTTLVVDGTFTGTRVGIYGSLQLNSNGSYTYTLNNSSALVQALSQGQVVTDSFGYKASDGSLLSNLSTLTITITGANDAPTIAGVADSAINDKQTVNPFSGVTIGDVDSPAQTQTVTVRLDTAAKGALTNLSGFTDMTGGVYRFMGTAAAATAAIRSLVFDPTENRVVPGLTETTTFTIEVSDGVVTSPVTDNTTDVTVTSVNDAPVNTVPGTQTIQRNGSRVFNTANGNVIRVDDVDAGNNPIQVVLSVNSGTLSLAAIPGVTVGGSGTASVTVTGNRAVVNTGLMGLTFQSVFGFTGQVTLTVTTTDLDPCPMSLQDIDAFFINVVNTRPSTTPSGLPGVFTYAGTLNTVLSVPVSTGLVRGAVDADGDPLTAVVLTPPSVGTLSLNPNGSFTYTPPTSFMGQVTFTFRYFDGLEYSDPITVTLNIAGPTTTPPSRRR